LELRLDKQKPHKTDMLKCTAIARKKMFPADLSTLHCATYHGYVHTTKVECLLILTCWNKIPEGLFLAEVLLTYK